MRPRVRYLANAAALLAATACSNAGSERVLAVSATGSVSGFVYFDADGSLSLTSGDDSLKGVRVDLVAAGDTLRLIDTTRSRASGFYRFGAVPVGEYAVRVDTTTLGDTIQVLRVDSAKVTVVPGDSAVVNIGAGYPMVGIAAARALPAGRSVFLTGVALNASTTFADTVVYLADASGAIRLTRLRSAVALGDSVRVRGTTARRDSLPTFDDVRVTRLGTGLLPAPAQLSLAAARTAVGAKRDAALVVVRGVTVLSTTAGATTTSMLVGDGTDTLEVLLDGNADLAFRPTQLGADYIHGNRFDIVGVLAPAGSGVWRLKPRASTDLTIIPLPVTTIAAARGLPPGQLVVVVGVALNGSGVFSDTTVSLADNTGSIRLTRLRTSVSAGDSVKVRATTSTRDGQPTLDDVTSTSLGRGLIPAAAALSTQVTATADGGRSDAALAIVHNATVSDTATVAANFTLTVSDGSGNLRVVLDRAADVTFRAPQLPGVYIPGNKFDIVGVLVPTGTGTWQLKPRSSADLTRR